VDYTNHRVTFFEALDPGDVVTADVFVAGSSAFVIRPYGGAAVDIDEVEVQYGVSISMRDSVLFVPYVTDPSNPSGPKIPLEYEKIVYQSKQDFVNECNGAYPLISKGTSANPSERDLPEDMQIFKWNYKTETKVSDSVAPGFEIRIFLENDQPFLGAHDRSAVVATLYCRVL